MIIIKEKENEKLTVVMILIALILSPMFAKGEVESKVVKRRNRRPEP